MGDPKGFMKYERQHVRLEPPQERIRHFREFYLPAAKRDVHTQASRCMDCGTPFCHSGCPLGNDIPAFNDAVYAGDWDLAYQVLSKTNNFPEFTGRICPAPCEAACVLNINSDAVTIEHIEKEIAEYAFDAGLVRPDQPPVRTGKSVAVVGSGPAGLAAAAQLNAAGHHVIIYERDDKPGGLLRFGIPDFKLDKAILDRRIAIMRDSGIAFHMQVELGKDLGLAELAGQHDAVILCCGSSVPRDLNIPGRHLAGIHFAMDYLKANNRYVSGLEQSVPPQYSARNKDVIVIGGGDTGADCIGTAHRQGARSVIQLELLPKPPEGHNHQTPWPAWPVILRSSTSHEEGGQRAWAVLTKEFIGTDHLRAVKVANILWEKDETGRYTFVEHSHTERQLPCDLVLLAMGFQHPEQALAEKNNLHVDEKGNYVGVSHQTQMTNVFVCGDMRKGQSLVVWAIADGRQAARSVHSFLGY